MATYSRDWQEAYACAKALKDKGVDEKPKRWCGTLKLAFAACL